MISRRTFLKKSMLGTMALSALGITSQCRKLKKRPNVLFIICDDLNDWVEDLGGHPQAHTPNIDRLMSSGVSFTNAFSNNPVCGPSRTSFLTGIYPHNSGYFGYNQNAKGMEFRNFAKLKNAKTMMEHFYDNGYNVYGTGKVFHNGHEDWSVWQGYDEGEKYFGIEPTFGPLAWNGSYKKGTHDHAIGLPHPQILPDPDSYKHWGNSFASLANIPEYPPEPEKSIPGYKGWICFGEPFHYNGPADRDLTPDELNAEYAGKILKKDHARPFFLTVGFNRPHTPLHAPKKYFDMFPLDKVKMPKIKEDDLLDCADALWNPIQTWNDNGFKKYDFLTEHPKPEMLKKWVRAYLACIAFVDDQIGKLLSTLKDSKYADDTIVVFTSDHGYHEGEKEWVFKASLWEESSRVPFVIDHPGLKNPGADVSHPISLIDIYPTLIDMCNLPQNPNENTNQMPLDGYSLTPFLADPDTEDWPGPDIALISVASDTRLDSGEAGKPEDQFYAARSARYRYILCPNGEEELYDHKNDPYEWHNLADDSKYRNVKKQLNEQLKALVFEQNK